MAGAVVILRSAVPAIKPIAKKAIRATKQFIIKKFSTVEGAKDTLFDPKDLFREGMKKIKQQLDKEKRDKDNLRSPPLVKEKIAKMWFRDP